jgi:hypothetical protein
VRIAELPWYDVPELVAATDAWWRGIARHLQAAGVEESALEAGWFELPAPMRSPLARGQAVPRRGTAC